MTSGLAWLGSALAFAGMVSYFLVAVRWPDLRDSGHLNVGLCGAGAAIAAWGLARAVARQQGWRSSLVAAGLALLVLAFLAGYVYWLSYRLPPASNVIAVGAPAPAFQLRDQRGDLRSLSEFRGQKILLVFFRGHW